MKKSKSQRLIVPRAWLAMILRHLKDVEADMRRSKSYEGLDQLQNAMTYIEDKLA